MRNLRWMIVLLTLMAVPCLWSQTSAVHTGPFRNDFKTASDGVTKGWRVDIPWPDKDDTSQNWRTIGVRVIIARHGHVVRRIDGGVGIWNWSFWKGGQQVAIERGPVHGETGCDLIEIKSGRTVESWPGDCRVVSETDNVPDWVKAASDNFDPPKTP